MNTFLKTKRLGWGVIFALVTCVALMAYFAGQRYLVAMNAVEHTLAVQSGVNGTLSLLKDAETGQRGFLLSGDEQFLEPYDDSGRDLPPLFAKLVAATRGDTQQAARLVELQGLIEQKRAFIDETLQARRDRGLARALALVRSGRGKALMDDIRQHCRVLLEHEERTLQARKREAEAAQRMATWGIGLGSLLTALLAFLSLVTVQRDVAELKSTAEDLAKSEEHYRLLTEQSSDLVRLLRLDGSVGYVSPSVERILGYTVEEYSAQKTLSLMHPDELHLAREMLADIQSGKLSGGMSTYRLRHKSGDFRWLEVRWGVRRGPDGRPIDLHTTAHDVTERRQNEAQLASYASELKNLSLRDELTGLLNRCGFLEVAAQSHSLALRDARPAALIFIDLNGMKRINDELGHDVGDEALQDTAHVLSAALHGSDVIARLGGDEFVAFVLDFSEPQLGALRTRLRELADARVAEQARPFRLSMSVGAAFLGSGSTLGITELLDRADGAMYEQKNARRAAGGHSVPPAPPQSRS